jgi:hypothetical protein
MAETLYKVNTSGYDAGMAKKEPFNLRLDGELMQRMNAHATREGRSRNALIEWMMRAYDSDSRIRDLVRQYVEPSSE